MVKDSNVDPNDLRMTVIKGSKLTTVAKVAPGAKATGSGGIKVKINKKDGVAKITCRDTGSATLPMEDGLTYTIYFTVDRPKGHKVKIPVGNEPVKKTVNDLFNTDIDSGEFSYISKKNIPKSTVSGDNTVYIYPEVPGTIKLNYSYMNKKYNVNITVK